MFWLLRVLYSILSLIAAFQSQRMQVIALLTRKCEEDNGNIRKRECV